MWSRKSKKGFLISSHTGDVNARKGLRFGLLSKPDPTTARVGGKRKRTFFPSSKHQSLRGEEHDASMSLFDVSVGEILEPEVYTTPLKTNVFFSILFGNSGCRHVVGCLS